MSKQSLTARIPAYKQAFASGEIQKTYQSLVGIVQTLRTEFHQKYKGEMSVANVLHGYIDFTYFYLQNDYLKQRKLKLAIVFNHQQAQFELWLLGQTKDVQLSYWQKLRDVKWVDKEVMPEYSIFEITLLSTPDFDDTDKLSACIHSEFTTLTSEIFETLLAYE
ncbi:DUF7000 family protein [Paraglaciecola sp. 2405UD69-4]|uniref:DUF7000 family protein n=1 Tax=Paraglaciecola sp. 2405UD69-4 TaxID=3391836 RepID=UPI0039C9FB70